MRFKSRMCRTFSSAGGRFEPAIYFVSGAMSEVAASLFTLPLEVAKSRLQLGKSPHRATGGIIPHHENFPSVRHALTSLYKDRGFRGLYSGWHSVLLQVTMSEKRGIVRAI